MAEGASLASCLNHYFSFTSMAANEPDKTLVPKSVGASHLLWERKSRVFASALLLADSAPENPRNSSALGGDISKR